MKRTLILSSVYTLGFVSAPACALWFLESHSRKHPELDSSERWRNLKTEAKTAFLYALKELR